MRILILNWRDIRSPRGGGAERVTHEAAVGLVRRGHDVTWLSSTARDLPRYESIDGIRIVRSGNEATTRLFAPRLARRIKPDVVLEEINTLPYLAPLWSRAPVVLYINQLARDVWWYEAPPPLAAAGRLAEPLYLQAYRRCDAITISLSTTDDLRRIGLRGSITVVPMAAGVPRVEVVAPRAREGRMIAIGRLTPSKRYHHAIEALALLRSSHQEATLLLVGEGRERERLERYAHALGISDVVRFAGRVPHQEKIRMLDEADVLVGTSVREGWGLTITEAAARGIPSVVYDIPGFRDAVVPGRTGVTVSSQPAALAWAVASLLEEPSRYEYLRRNAWASVSELAADAAADAFAGVLESRVTSATPPSSRSSRRGAE